MPETMNQMEADSPVQKASRANNLHRHNGSWRRASDRVDWHIDIELNGMVTMRRPIQVGAGQDPLAVHAEWKGPVKLVKRQGQAEARYEFHVSELADFNLDRDAAAATEDLLTLLFRRGLGSPQTQLDDWQPPEASQLANWLADAGRECAIDKDQNLRLTLKRPGVDGQVRIERGPGRLRLTLPLGTWSTIESDAQVAAHGLAELANARYRLVRLAWLTDAAGQRCEAQVDLSGLPPLANGGGNVETFWRSQVNLAIGGLDLALRQLGLELPLLADPANQHVTALVLPRIAEMMEPRRAMKP